jgi:hypothetical protein
MPYISQDKRAMLEPALAKVFDALRQIQCDFPDDSFEGTMNYLFTTLLVRSYTLNNYDEHNRVIGLLDCVKNEYYQRRVVPYERQKSFDNGDVY